ncbi:hypothetical protein BDQ17DRAFT_1437441 [Cyathus striatus]|nr:hypothetical protein BDQ17DRAFT_1437441 [Cyathus striatus]
MNDNSIVVINDDDRDFWESDWIGCGKSSPACNLTGYITKAIDHKLAIPLEAKYLDRPRSHSPIQFQTIIPSNVITLQSDIGLALNSKFYMDTFCELQSQKIQLVAALKIFNSGQGNNNISISDDDDQWSKLVAIRYYFILIYIDGWFGSSRSLISQN